MRPWCDVNCPEALIMYTNNVRGEFKDKSTCRWLY